MAIGALLRLLASVPEVRRTDIGLSTDPMRSITDSGTVDRSSGGVWPCCPSLLRSLPVQDPSWLSGWRPGDVLRVVPESDARKVSEHRRQRVNEEIKRIVGEAHDEAARLLADNRDRLAMRSPRR
jgi:hypothetical protein